MTKSGFDLDEIERLLAAATPGPEYTGSVQEDDRLDYTDEELDAAVHVALPALLTEIRELRAENARLRVECEFIASATASPLVNSLETGFRHSPLSPSERETRYMEACALAHQSACVALTGEPS